MSAKEKTLCKWDKEALHKDFKKFKKLVSNPKFVCAKCLRVSKKKAVLCRPVPLLGEKSNSSVVN